MKVSKVNHLRTAIQLKESKGAEFLYQNPSKDGSPEKDLREHLAAQTKKAENLYSIFNSKTLLPFKDKTIDFKAEERNVKGASKNVFIKGMISKYGDGLPGKEELLKKFYNLADTNRTESAFFKTDDDIKLLKKGFRKSLNKAVYVENQRIEISEVLYRLLCVLVLGKASGYYGKIGQDEAYVFFKVLHEDYYRTETNKKIIDSFANKDVRVQVIERDGRYLLAPSNYDHKKKQAIFNFMKEYAAGDSEKRDQMRLHFRRLVLLYIYGEMEYKDYSDLGVTAVSYGPLLDKDKNFSDQAETDIAEIAKNRAEKKKKQELFDRETDRNKSFSLKDEIKAISKTIGGLRADYSEVIKDTIAINYRKAASVDGLTADDLYWLQYIEGEVEKITDYSDRLRENHLKARYLSERVYKDFISFIAMKYIEYGKAVYHFALSELSTVKDGKTVAFGEVAPEFQKGINSFDYEMIKADETLTRNISVSTTLAASVFSKASAKDEYREKKGQEDPMLYSDAQWNEAIKSQAVRNILMYFGGKSKWEDSEVMLLEPMDIVKSFGSLIYSIRNWSFHYAGSSGEVAEDVRDNAKLFFDEEFSRLGAIQREKYLSNNVPVFYKTENINQLMDHLYTRRAEREAQVPAFGNVIKKKDIPDFIRKYVDSKDMANIPDSNGILEKYRATLYFLLKDIYYYGFLQEPDILERFKKTLEKGKANAENLDAYDNFKERVGILCKSGEISFGVICQDIMTEYNMQNQGEFKIRSQKEEAAREKAGNGKIYQHFKMLLYKTIRDAFYAYLEEQEYVFLKNPIKPRLEYAESDKGEEFIRSWSAENAFKYLKEDVEKDDSILSWYVLSHFLTPRQNNLLQGDIRSYIQYVGDVSRRAEGIEGVRVPKVDQTKIESYERILSMLEFTLLFSGKVSNEITDYYDDEDDYARHLRNYVVFCGKKEEDNAHLAAFSLQPISYKLSDGKTKASKTPAGIYHNGTKAIVNKNVVFALMFGNEAVTANACEAVNNIELSAYFSLMDSLAEVFKRGTCKTKEEQEDLRKFQNEKNRIELHDVLTFSEMINDFMGQFVNYSYFRERDLMYFQLGAFYTRLFFGDAIPEDSRFRTLEGSEVHITDGAILYQICALYAHDLPLVVLNGDEAVISKDGNAGREIPEFVKKYCGESMGNPETYNQCLELFEDIRLHDNMIDFRNDLDHLKYYIKPTRSIMEIFTQLYNGFFDYDLKLKKSLSYIFSNILERYFVTSAATMQAGSAKVSIDKNIVEKRVAKFNISARELDSDTLTFKNLTVKNEKTGKTSQKNVSLPARGEKFLKETAKILNYKMS